MESSRALNLLSHQRAYLSHLTNPRFISESFEIVEGQHEVGRTESKLLSVLVSRSLFRDLFRVTVVATA